MPIPKPKPKEKINTFMKRCIPFMKKEVKDKQAVAICYKAFKEKR